MRFSSGLLRWTFISTSIFHASTRQSQKGIWDEDQISISLHAKKYVVTGNSAWWRPFWDGELTWACQKSGGLQHLGIKWSWLESPGQWRKPCCLGYIGDYATQLNGDYFHKPLKGSLLNNQDNSWISYPGSPGFCWQKTWAGTCQWVLWPPFGWQILRLDVPSSLSKISKSNLDLMHLGWDEKTYLNPAD